MLRDCLLLLSLISVSTALTCYKCAVFNTTKMTTEEQSKIAGVMKLLTAPTCDSKEEEVTEKCTENQDQCHKIAVSAKLGGANDHEGYLVQCGLSSALATNCDTYKFLAGGAGIPLDSCETTGCSTDKCFDPFPNSGVAFHYNLYILIASVSTFLLSAL